MIFLENVSFIYVIIFILVYNVTNSFFKRKIISNFLLLLGSIIILNCLTSLESIGILISTSVFVFLGGVFLSRKKENNRIYLLFFIAILISLFVVKNYKIVEISLLERVGISYILFRLLHFLIDSSKNKIKNYNLISFINYIIFFPTFIAGPIDEFNNFSYWISQKRKTYRTILFKIGTFKLIIGIFKKFLIVPLIINYSADFSLFEDQLLWQENFLISLILYSLYILFDFSGYSDIAIGTAYLIGIKTPENFNNPYFSTNLSIFWKKWHMTFSNFLFKYLFKPLVINLSKLLNNFPRLLVSSIGYLITFIVCGIWHGNTLSFIYWGLWHGFGLIIFKLWDIYIHRKYTSKIKNKIIYYLHKSFAILITFCFVTMGWFFFNYQTNEIKMILDNITLKNSEIIETEDVTFNGEKFCKLVYNNKNVSNVDIVVKSSKSDHDLKFLNIPKSKDNSYFIENKYGKTLTKIKFRATESNRETKWHTSLLYIGANDIKQNWFESKFFEKKKTRKLKYKPTNILKEKLILDSSHINQKIKAFPEFIENYGWAITINYKPSNFNVMIEYKYENGEWMTYQKNRSGKYNFVNIHGNKFHNGLERNLAPGHYNIRIKYHDNFISSDFFNSSILVPNYVNE